MANSTEQLLDHFQQSEKRNEKLKSLLDDFDALSNAEKLVFCLNLPTGANRDSNRPYSWRLGSKNESGSFIHGHANYEIKVKAEVVQTMSWIKTHLWADKEQCLAKQEVFEDYVQFCKKQNIKHIGREDFGKLMKSVYPSVTTRRLGIRGQTKHCYGGLAKRTEIESPVLPEIKDLKEEDTDYGPVQLERKSLDTQIDKKDVVKACCAVIVEWAQKLLDENFTTINDIAEHLVLKSFVNVTSEAAYTILSQVPKYREDIVTAEPQASRSTPQFSQQTSSSGGKSARLQLQMKLQEKERMKEQRRKLQEQRCAITGESPPNDGHNDSIDSATVSYDASVSSETTTSNPDQFTRNVTVPKPILPKPVPLIMPSNAYPTHPSSNNIGSKNSSFACIGSSGQSPTTPQRPASTPVFIVSPTPNSPSLNQMVLVSPLPAGPFASLTSQPSKSSVQQQQPPVSTAHVTHVSPPPTTGNTECDNSCGASSIKADVHKTKTREHVMDTGAASGSPLSYRNGDVSARTSVSSVENMHDTAAIKANNSQESIRDMSSSKELFKSPENDKSKSERNREVIQRSQSMPEIIEHTSAKTVIEQSTNPQKVQERRGPGNKSIKQEDENTSNSDMASQNIPHGVYINFKLQDSDSGGTNVAVPIGTLNPAAIPTNVLQDSDPNVSSSSTQLASNLVSALNAQIQSMLQKGGGQAVTPQQKKTTTSKTVSSLLKEQRVRVTSPECIGRNKYVNDNRPVAQILKEIREKKKNQGNSPKAATQSFSFAEDLSPEEAREHLTSQKILRERIAREALVMRKAHVPSSVSRPRRKSRQEKILISPARSPVNAGTPKRKDIPETANSKLQDLLNDTTTGKLKEDCVTSQNVRHKVSREDFSSSERVNRFDKESATAQNMSSDADMNASIGRKETQVLKLLLEEALGKDTFNKVLTDKNVAPSTNPKLASLLSSNTKTEAVNSPEKKQALDMQKNLISQLLQRISDATYSSKTSQLESTVSQPPDCNTTWDQTQSMSYRQMATYPTSDSNSGNIDYQDSNTTNEILDLVTARNMENEAVSSRSASCMEMNSAFMPIQNAAEGNTVSPVKPQVKTVDTNYELSSRGTQMNAKLKALLSQESSRQNSPTENVQDMYNTGEWVASQSSNFVSYSQNVPDENMALNMNMTNPDIQPIQAPVDSNFSESNSNSDYMVSNTAFGSTLNNNGGFASMVGVKPPMKRTMDAGDRGLSNKRSRHLSDQSHIRPKRSEFFPPFQPLLPQEQTMGHESLPLASPSSHGGYSHCPPESPFSPEVHDIMSNTSDVFNGDFNNAMSTNSLRSVSVPAHNFMQGDMELGAVSGAYLSPDGGMLSGLQCPPHNYNAGSSTQQQQGTTNYSYQQPTTENNINSAYRTDNNNSATYNNVKKNLLQILESRLSSEGFRNAANQNLRGDHMISGASVKLPQNLRHKIGESLNSVMIQNMNQNVQYSGPGLMHGQINPLQVPNPTPPESHPPTPVEFCNDVNEKYDGNHGYPMNQQVGMGCNIIPTTVDGTPTSLENVSSQSSRESLADPLFNMCEEGSGGAEMQGNNQFDFLRIL